VVKGEGKSMIYKCTNCDAALKYNPSLRLLECDNCCSVFRVEDVTPYEEEGEVVQTSPSSTDDWDEWDNTDDSDTMECNIYSCTACGAELAVNGVEASTFCAYCGQPTIVFNRVSKEKRPKYIIPFQFEKEQAIEAIREKLNKGFFVPKDIKNFEVERVRGIYVPFWKFDLYYHDKQYLRGTVGSGKHRKTRYFYREAEADFKGITADASRQLSDESSQRLEPFDLTRLRPFDVGYMTGFYADTYDVDRNETEKIALSRAMELYNTEVKKSVRASNISILSTAPETRVNNVEYIMLPVWFMTFRYLNEAYTILVNGQTGKIIGAVPYFKRKVFAFIMLIGTILTPVISAIMYFLINSEFAENGENALGFLTMSVFIAGIMGLFAWGNFHKVSKSIKLTKATTMNDFVKNRQEV